MKNDGILYVFLVFQTAGLAEKIRRLRSGIYSEVPLSAKLLLQRSQLQAVSVSGTGRSLWEQQLRDRQQRFGAVLALGTQNIAL